MPSADYCAFCISLVATTGATFTTTPATGSGFSGSWSSPIATGTVEALVSLMAALSEGAAVVYHPASGNTITIDERWLNARTVIQGTPVCFGHLPATIPAV